MKDIYEKIKALALEHHKGIFREDGVTPYYNHVAAVDNIVTNWFEQGKYLYWFSTPEFRGLHPFNIYSDAGRNDLKYVLKSIAIAHDMLEDKDVNGNLFNWYYNFHFLLPDYHHILNGIKGVTRLPHEKYVHFILRAKKNALSRYVKAADLTHNLSDLKPGARKDKYQLAEYILLQDEA